MRFKRLSLALIVLSMSFSLFAAHSMFFSAGDYDALNLYGPRGNKVDALTEMTQSGYIIQTGEWEAIEDGPMASYNNVNYQFWHYDRIS